jgi:hypothetical protein
VTVDRGKPSKLKPEGEALAPAMNAKDHKETKDSEASFKQYQRHVSGIRTSKIHSIKDGHPTHVGDVTHFPNGDVHVDFKDHREANEWARSKKHHEHEDAEHVLHHMSEKDHDHILNVHNWHAQKAHEESLAAKNEAPAHGHFKDDDLSTLDNHLKLKHKLHENLTKKFRDLIDMPG